MKKFLRVILIGLLSISLTGITFGQGMDCDNPRCQGLFADCFDRLAETSERLRISNENLDHAIARNRNRDIILLSAGVGSGVVISLIIMAIIPR
jgi:hypothetical protein